MPIKKQKISPEIPWYFFFTISFLFGFLGGLILFNSYEYNSYVGHYYYKNTGLFSAWVFFSIAVVLDIFALKSLITESHIKALEIFYGKEREVKFDFSEKTPKKTKKSNYESYDFFD